MVTTTPMLHDPLESRRIGLYSEDGDTYLALHWKGDRWTPREALVKITGPILKVSVLP